MKHFATICAAALLTVSSLSFAIEGEKAPTAVIARAKELTLKKDYPALLAMIPELDARFADKYDSVYFTSLAGIELGMTQAFNLNKTPDVDRVWAFRKLTWKIILAPYTGARDPREILEFKEFRAINGFSLSHLVRDEESGEQRAALRTDAIALLNAYADFLRAHIIPNYKPLFEIGPMSVADLRVRSKEEAKKEAAEWEKLRALSTENSYKNNEQDKLTDMLSRVGESAARLVTHDFAYPPEDNAAALQLLDTFPSIRTPRVEVLKELAHEKAMQKGARERAGQFRQNQAARAKTP